MQSITYNQYLPLILGRTMMSRYGLNPTPGTSYDDSTDPTIYSSYATAALRFGHSQIYNAIRMSLVDGTLKATAGLYSTMFNPDRFYKGNGYTVMQRVGNFLWTSMWVLCIILIEVGNSPCLKKTRTPVILFGIPSPKETHTLKYGHVCTTIILITVDLHQPVIRSTICRENAVVKDSKQ